MEAGTHIIFDALMCPYRMGERVRALRLLRSVTSEMLLMWDRGLYSYAMVQSMLGKGCDYLGRIPANVKFLCGKTFRRRLLPIMDLSIRETTKKGLSTNTCTSD